MSPRPESRGSSADPSAAPPPAPLPQSQTGVSRDDAAAVPDVAVDDTDGGWGDRRDGRRSDEWYRRERPPHHG